MTHVRNLNYYITGLLKLIGGVEHLNVGGFLNLVKTYIFYPTQPNFQMLIKFDFSFILTQKSSDTDNEWDTEVRILEL